MSVEQPTFELNVPKQSTNALIGKISIDEGVLAAYQERHRKTVCGSSKKYMSKVGIIGMDKIFKDEYNYVRRFLWCMVILCNLSISVWWIYDRVIYYMSEPILANVQLLETNQIGFPAVTICNQNPWDTRKLQEQASYVRDSNDIGLLAGAQGQSLVDLWFQVGHTRSTMVKECWFGRNKTCESRGSWSTTLTVMGVCQTLYLHETAKLTGIFNGLDIILEDTTTPYSREETGFKVLLHHNLDNPTVQVRTHGFTLPLGWEKDVTLHIKELKTLNLKRRPCHTSSTYRKNNCISQCFSRRMLTEAVCIMPYMTGLAALSNSSSCDTPTKYKQAESELQHLLQGGGFNTQECRCERQCTDTLYDYSLNSEDIRTKRNSHQSRLRIFFQDMTYISMHEHPAYSIVELFAEMGGTFGLLLGASILTFIQFGEACFLLCNK